MNLDQITQVGHGLTRAECVLAHQSGLLFCSESSGGGGVTVLRPDGSQRKILARDAAAPLHPNGIALLPGGAFLLAHLGTTDGGVWRLDADGHVEPFLLDVGGERLPPTNFVARDAEGRIWISVSTRQYPRDRDYRLSADGGYIVVVDQKGARVAAEGLGYTNECIPDAASGRLYVNETFGRRISSFRIGSGGTLSDRRVVTTFGAGVFPDGVSLDAEGGLWVTSVVNNQLIRVAPDGTQEVVLDDGDPAYVAEVERVFQAGEMRADHIARTPLRRLRNISSLAFGGPDLRTGYLGSLSGDSILRVPMPVAGWRPAHWDVDLGPLQANADAAA